MTSAAAATDRPHSLLPDLDVDAMAVVAEPDDPRPGAWVGGPSVVWHDGSFVLAYRMRRPIGEGRGYANVVAVSRDGVRFHTVATVHRDAFGGDSLERPCLVRTPEGRWRMYVSVATPDTKHWRVDLLEADDPAGFTTATARTVMPGDATRAVKDPVVVHAGGRWHAWVCVHPLDDSEATDRMSTDYATSDDGVDWTWHGTAIKGRPGEWDARGARVTAALLDIEPALFCYDGRATAEQNWEETTGLAVADGGLGRLSPLDGPVGTSPYGLNGLRYLTAATLPDGSRRWYVEVTRADGAHDLRTTCTVP